MLLYITAEDVFGHGTPERRGPRPLHTIPASLSALYDMGMRHHVRDSVLRRAVNGGFEAMPDWQLDRQVIRIALLSRETLGLEPGRRAAVFGRLSWLWPAVDFAATGFGAVSLGIEHDVSDEALEAALRQAEPRVVFATDSQSAKRLEALAAAGRLVGTTLVAEALDSPTEDRIPLGRLLDLGGTLDTPERAQGFRVVCRQASPDTDALWHASAAGLVRLSHAEAMARIGERLRAEPASPGDLAYVAGPVAGLARRLALHRYVGDGLTSAAVGREGRESEDVAELRPHKIAVGAAWLEAACAGRGPRWPAGLDRARARRRVRESLGDRVRFVETEREPGLECVRALSAAGVRVSSSGGSVSRSNGH